MCPNGLANVAATSNTDLADVEASKSKPWEGKQISNSYSFRIYYLSQHCVCVIGASTTAAALWES